MSAMGKWQSIHQVDYKVLVGHVRRMVSVPDPLVILVRGMILIDRSLEGLIEAFGALTYKRVDEVLNHPTLLQKATFACSLGAISQGELACIKEINALRNRIAHRLSAEIEATDEARVVNVFKAQTKLFSGLDYEAKQFPKTLIFLLLVLFHVFTLRSGRPGAKIVHVADDNAEAVAAITLTTTIIKVVKANVETDDAKIVDILKSEVDAAKRVRDEHRAGQDLTAKDAADKA